MNVAPFIRHIGKTLAVSRQQKAVEAAVAEGKTPLDPSTTFRAIETGVGWDPLTAIGGANAVAAFAAPGFTRIPFAGEAFGQITGPMEPSLPKLRPRELASTESAPTKTFPNAGPLRVAPDLPVNLKPRDPTAPARGRDNLLAPTPRDYSWADRDLNEAWRLAQNPTPMPTIPNADMNDVEGLVTLIAGFYGQGAQLGSAAWDSARKRAQETTQKILTDYQSKEENRRIQMEVLQNRGRMSYDKANAIADARDRANEINARNAPVEPPLNPDGSNMAWQQAGSEHQMFLDWIESKGGLKNEGEVEWAEERIWGLEQAAKMPRGFLERPGRALPR